MQNDCFLFHIAIYLHVSNIFYCVKKKKEMKENKTLSDRIRSVSISDYPAFRKEVFERIVVSRATWSNWKLGKSEPDYSTGKIIDDILMKFGY